MAGSTARSRRDPFAGVTVRRYEIRLESMVYCLAKERCHWSTTGFSIAGDAWDEPPRPHAVGLVLGGGRRDCHVETLRALESRRSSRMSSSVPVWAHWLAA